MSSRMRSLEAAIEIRASPEAIFDLIHDYPRRLEWDPFLKEACLLEGAGAAGLGVKARCTARNGFAGLAMLRVLGRRALGIALDRLAQA